MASKTLATTANSLHVEFELFFISSLFHWPCVMWPMLHCVACKTCATSIWKTTRIVEGDFQILWPLKLSRQSCQKIISSLTSLLMYKISCHECLLFNQIYMLLVRSLLANVLAGSMLASLACNKYCFNLSIFSFGTACNLSPNPQPFSFLCQFPMVSTLMKNPAASKDDLTMLLSCQTFWASGATIMPTLLRGDLLISVPFRAL